MLFFGLAEKPEKKFLQTSRSYKKTYGLGVYMEVCHIYTVNCTILSVIAVCSHCTVEIARSVYCSLCLSVQLSHVVQISQKLGLVPVDSL